MNQHRLDANSALEGDKSFEACDTGTVPLDSSCNRNKNSVSAYQADRSASNERASLSVKGHLESEDGTQHAAVSRQSSDVAGVSRLCRHRMASGMPIKLMFPHD